MDDGVLPQSTFLRVRVFPYGVANHFNNHSLFLGTLLLHSFKLSQAFLQQAAFSMSSCFTCSLTINLGKSSN